MQKKEYLTEENYEKGVKKLRKIAITILVVCFLIGGALITIGLVNQVRVNAKYSDKNIAKVSEQLEVEKKELLKLKSSLEAKGLKYDSFAEYTDGEVYDLYIITRVLDPGRSYCSTSEYKVNALTAEYCSLTNELEYLKNDVHKTFDSSDNVPFYMFGSFIIIAGCMFAGYFYFFSKGRDIMAFTTQQTMPVAQEGIEKMAPTAGKVAKEISKGIEEGKNEAKK